MRRLHFGDEGSSSSAQNVASIDDLSLQILSRLRLKPLFRFISRLKRKKKTKHFETSDEHQQSSSSAQTVASIDDILLQILSRLRLKPLFRFKSVSKHWNSLIYDLKLHPIPAAVGLIVCPTERRNSFACVVPFEKSDGPTFLPKPKRHNVEIKSIHGCNGLLVYSAKTPNTLRHFVANPTTMQRKMLPEPMHPERILAMCLAFDPSNSPRYRVVCVSGCRLRGREYLYDRFQVYTSETGSWRYTSMEAFRGFLDVGNGVYWNGALHWIPVCPGQNSIYFDPDDIDHQMPRVFPTPPTRMSWNNHAYGNYFGESCGHLHFVGQVITGVLRVYEMKTDYSEWFVKYRVRLSTCGLLTQLRLDSWSSHCICALIRGAKDEDCFFVLWDRGRITRHNILSLAFEVLRDLPQHPHSCLGVSLPYFESTCSV